MRALLASLLAMALLAPPAAQATGASLGVYPAPAAGRPSHILLVAEARDAAGPRLLTLAVDPAVAVVAQCGGLLFTGTWSPAAVPCATTGEGLGIGANVPARGVLVMIVETDIVAAGEFVVTAQADGEALSYSAATRWQAYAPLVGAAP